MQYGNITLQPGVLGRGHLGALCTSPYGRGEPAIISGIIVILIEGVECGGTHLRSQDLGDKSGDLEFEVSLDSEERLP